MLRAREKYDISHLEQENSRDWMTGVSRERVYIVEFVTVSLAHSIGPI